MLVRCNKIILFNIIYIQVLFYTLGVEYYPTLTALFYTELLY